MQRLDPRSFSNAFHLTHNNAVGDPREYYRFVVYPTNPSPNYSIQNNKLTFSFHSESRPMTDGNIEIKQHVSNLFNVRAMIANNYHQLLESARARLLNTPHHKSPALVLDIEKNYFNQHATITETPYRDLNQDEHFVPKTRVLSEEGCFTNHIHYKQSEPKAIDPVYSQTITNHVAAPGLIGYSNVYSEVSATRQNPLKDDEGARVEIFEYGQNEQGEPLGNDILLSSLTPRASIAHRRTIKNETEWFSDVSDINRKSYLSLTKQLQGEQGNAEQIGELFADYAKKGSGFSALIHFHLFRHDQTIQKAKEIAKDLAKDSFSRASNMDIAKYLLEKYDSLKATDFTVNPKGSFARRTNYAILQLTNGLCQNIDEFRTYQAEMNAPRPNQQ